MKHAVILAHPAERSFNRSVADTYCKAVTALGQTAVLRDLYAMDFDPRLGAGELPFAPLFHPAPDVEQERKLISDAEVFALVYPLWLNSPPAILKGYLERVFGAGFAYGPRGQPLLAGKKLISLTSSGSTDHWLRETGGFEAVRALFDGHFAQVCGMTVVDHIHFGSIVPGIRADWVETALKNAGHTIEKHFGGAP